MLRGKRVNPLKKKLLYNFSSKVQSLGPGSCVINITGHIDQTVAGLTYINLRQLINASYEWSSYVDRYKLYKIEQIAVTIYPNDQLDNSPTYINLDWFEAVNTIDGLPMLDNSKIVYNDLKKPKTFFFKPPNMVLDGGNPRKFNVMTYEPVAKLYFQQNDGTLRGRVDARIVFKVPSEYLSNKKINLKRVDKLVKLDESDMMSENLKIINNSRLTGIHQNSFSYISKEKEVPEEEKLEEDEEEPKKITEDKEEEWSLFKQLCEEDEKERNKRREKNKKKKERKKKLKKEMKERIKKSKLFKKMLNKEKDKILKEAKSDATFAEQIRLERKEQAEKHYQKRKELGKRRKEQKVKNYQEDPMKVINQQLEKRETRRLLLKRNQVVTEFLTKYGSSQGTNMNLNKIWNEQEKIKRALQHLNRGKLDEKDKSYLGELNRIDNKDLVLDC